MVAPALVSVVDDDAMRFCSGTSHPVSGSPLQVHDGQHAHDSWKSGVENSVRKTADQTTTDRSEYDMTGLRVLGYSITATLHFSQESSTEAGALHLIVPGDVVEFSFG
jgi:hypothetical protein